MPARYSQYYDGISIAIRPGRTWDGTDPQRLNASGWWASLRREPRPLPVPDWTNPWRCKCRDSRARLFPRRLHRSERKPPNWERKKRDGRDGWHITYAIPFRVWNNSLASLMLWVMNKFYLVANLSCKYYQNDQVSFPYNDRLNTFKCLERIYNS